MGLSQKLGVVLVLTSVHDATGQFCINDTSCNGHGRCPTICSSRCICDDFYTGVFCEIPPLCTENGSECGPNGLCNTCNTRANTFCQCLAGYGGRLCEIAPVCTYKGNECLNGGFCDFTAVPYNCSCPVTYLGTSPVCGAQDVKVFMTSLIFCVFTSFAVQ